MFIKVKVYSRYDGSLRTQWLNATMIKSFRASDIQCTSLDAPMTYAELSGDDYEVIDMPPEQFAELLNEGKAR